jgi:hypothetical protein
MTEANDRDSGLNDPEVRSYDRNRAAASIAFVTIHTFQL